MSMLEKRMVFPLRDVDDQVEQLLARSFYKSGSTAGRLIRPKTCPAIMQGFFFETKGYIPPTIQHSQEVHTNFPFNVGRLIWINPVLVAIFYFESKKDITFYTFK